MCLCITLVADGPQRARLRIPPTVEVIAAVVVLPLIQVYVLVANPKKLLYTVANPARGLLNRVKRTEEKV